ncbi:MAG: hypothetical protein AAFR75_08570 [Pseudomonadota bacterium]
MKKKTLPQGEGHSVLGASQSVQNRVARDVRSTVLLAFVVFEATSAEFDASGDQGNWPAFALGGIESDAIKNMAASPKNKRANALTTLSRKALDAFANCKSIALSAALFLVRCCYSICNRVFGVRRWLRKSIANDEMAILIFC